MEVFATDLPGVLRFVPRVFGDARGYFAETFHAERYREHGLLLPFVQDNVSKSRRGTLRGLHVQQPFAQGKLVSVLLGNVYDVAVDVRVGSPTFGKWAGFNLSEENHEQLYIPPGFAHGFCVTSDEALFVYKCTELYHPETELAVQWNDPALGITWPVQEPSLSSKDTAALPLAAIDRSRLPRVMLAANDHS